MSVAEETITVDEFPTDLPRRKHYLPPSPGDDIGIMKCAIRTPTPTAELREVVNDYNSKLKDIQEAYACATGMSVIDPSIVSFEALQREQTMRRESVLCAMQNAYHASELGTDICESIAEAWLAESEKLRGSHEATRAKAEKELKKLFPNNAALRGKVNSSTPVVESKLAQENASRASQAALVHSRELAEARQTLASELAQLVDYYRT